MFKQKTQSITIKNQQGFSLIEIMVVVIIIGMLAGLLVPQVMSRFEEAQIKTAKTNMKSLQAALKMYRLDNYQYPTSEQGLDALVTKPSTAPVPKNWKNGGYVESLPLDPWNNKFKYVSPGEGHEYNIYTLGADNVTGGEGQNADLSVWDQDKEKSE